VLAVGEVVWLGRGGGGGGDRNFEITGIPKIYELSDIQLFIISKSMTS